MRWNCSRPGAGGWCSAALSYTPKAHAEGFSLPTNSLTSLVLSSSTLETSLTARASLVGTASIAMASLVGTFLIMTAILA